MVSKTKYDVKTLLWRHSAQRLAEGGFQNSTWTSNKQSAKGVGLHPHGRQHDSPHNWHPTPADGTENKAVCLCRLGDCMTGDEFQVPGLPASSCGFAAEDLLCASLDGCGRRTHRRRLTTCARCSSLPAPDALPLAVRYHRRLCVSSRK